MERLAEGRSPWGPWGTCKIHQVPCRACEARISLDCDLHIQSHRRNPCSSTPCPFHLRSRPDSRNGHLSRRSWNLCAAAVGANCTEHSRPLLMQSQESAQQLVQSQFASSAQLFGQSQLPSLIFHPESSPDQLARQTKKQEGYLLYHCMPGPSQPFRTIRM